MARVPSGRAKQLVKRGAGIEESRNGKVYSIRILESPSPMKPPTPLTPASYGQRYVFLAPIRSGREQVGRVYEHKKIHAEDQDLFMVPFADVCKTG